LWLASSAAAAAPPLLVTLKNNSGLADNQVYVGFIGGNTLSATNVNTGQAVLASTYETPHWYTLDQLSKGISLTAFSGRIYVGYGTPWTFANPGYEPSATNPGDANYTKRYDKMEMTYFGNPADVADTSSIDYFSIPMTVKVFKGGPAGTLKGTLKSSSTATTLAALRTLTPTPDAAVVKDSGGNFVRAIGPGVYPPTGGLPASPYDNLGGYLTYLHDNYAPAHGGTVARIKGYFGGVGPAPTTPQTKGQNYDFTVTTNANRDLILTGTGDQVGGHTIVYKYADLVSPTGIYGANAPFTLDGNASGPGNDLYGWMAGDLLAGLNIGAVGSTVVRNGVEVGSMTSSQWFGLTNLFAGLQPNAKYYNAWAAAMGPLSDAYNFAYSDRFAPVTAPLDPSTVDTMEIDIGGASVPEPTALGVATLTVAALLRRQRAK
ncbi:MAG: hypothetical protein JWM57_2418, partial [Phycisphaerales bacterium]|nr:hypothetical protein [Phycisphaerales bacterium]